MLCGAVYKGTVILIDLLFSLLLLQDIVSWSFLWFLVPIKVSWGAYFLHTGQCVCLLIFRCINPFVVISYCLYSNLWLIWIRGAPLSAQGPCSWCRSPLREALSGPAPPPVHAKQGLLWNLDFCRYFHAAKFRGGIRHLETDATLFQVSRTLITQQVT